MLSNKHRESEMFVRMEHYYKTVERTRENDNMWLILIFNRTN